MASCGRQQVANNDDAQKQAQERLDEEHQARIERDLHEREAALDEQARLLAQRERQLSIAVNTPGPPPAQPPGPQPVAAVPPLPPVPPQKVPSSPDASYQTFYDALAPYGSWLDMPGYGYVWQPAATTQDPRWRPYTLGHWAYTDDGWTWVSDEPFGWVTYHYGRWMRTRTLNWVWAPGDQWAPAWVSWRSSNDFVGWAPLPPEARFDNAAGIQQWADQQFNLAATDYTFVPAADFGDESMAGDALPPEQNGPVYDDSNNVTNIYYGADDTGGYAIICYGPSYDFMRAKSHRPLGPKLGLKRGGFDSRGNHNAVVSGNTLEVTAPRLVRPASAPAPKQVRERVADVRMVTRSAPPPAQDSVPAQPQAYRAPETREVETGQSPREVRIVQPQPHQQKQQAQQQTVEAERQRPVRTAAPVVVQKGAVVVLPNGQVRTQQ